jgi:hypothetical protein
MVQILRRSGDIMRDIIEKWKEFIPTERLKEFENDLNKLTTKAWLNGERTAHEFPRGEGG